ncbi:hypothetical protein ACO22_05692 [Paracoccidioides brasiliensis]|uniref:Trafficking protein particle complex subunit 10 n=1 Tax=Paracoccidioides brasiliensis TaxID=121759 RepID=A0A1D2J9L0_PARBR|nr:hypothetical protein ACO22_05692 [Paracoccidioides brasiliensis]
MDAIPRTSSNVTVEYTDPSGLFPSIKPFILETLPLRNLHWKSPNRPLRSIDSLHIDLVPSQNTSEDHKRLSDAVSSTIPHRRHQIPGLRQTPYLKIYILSCDDNETYKTTARKEVREWIKTHGTPPQSSGSPPGSQDNHNAFEWLIIHVVSGAAETVEKPGTASKWPGRGSTTVLEKFKADFNGSSKSAVDRVAQLHIPKSESDKRPAELAGQLEDLDMKLKSSILTSFDSRVSQYEEDIRLKDSQRSLPGWNFCTFFILKEGLARGFEHVGLYEDALIGYDELAVGLDAALRDQIVAEGDQHGGTFLSYTSDIKAKAEKALGLISEDGEDDAEEDDRDSYEKKVDEIHQSDEIDYSSYIALDEHHFPLDPNKKLYREMILANNISVFDFRVYIFSRQLTLLLKAARAPSIRRGGLSDSQVTGKPEKEPEDLTLLAEVCERASEFISIGSRTLRHDLHAVLEDVEHDRNESRVADVINNIVYSWTYSAVSQVLIQTATDSIEMPKTSLRDTRDLMNTAVLSNFVAGTRPGVPKRSSSLSANTLINGSFENLSTKLHSGAQNRTPLASLNPGGSIQQKTGQLEFASSRGNLFLYARRTLENLGRRHGWFKNWRDLGLLFDSETEYAVTGLKEVSLDETGEGSQKYTAAESRAKPFLRGIENPPLMAAVKSAKNFHFIYEALTDQIFCYYVSANRTRSAEMAMADIAVIRYRAGDYATAASYFHQMSPFYSSSHWGVLEGAMLELYGRCLKLLGRKDDYVRILLKLLGIYAGVAQSGQKARDFQSKRINSAPPLSFSPTARTMVSNYVNDLFESSRSLSNGLSVPLKDFFGGIEVSPAIHHFKNKDGMLVQLSLRFLLGNSINVDSVKLRLVNSADVHSSEIWLENSGDVVLKSTTSMVPLQSFVSVHGKYLVDCIEVRVGNILFVQRHGSPSLSLSAGLQQPGTGESGEGDDHPFVFCYPPARGLEAKLSPPCHINLGELRTIEVALKSGWNNILKGILRVKPATAGLRLRITDASIVDGSVTLTGNGELGQIDFTDFGPDSSAKLSIPYTVEDDQTSLSARLEVVYDTPDGQFSYFSATSIISTLPLSVNVQDMFKNDSLMSRFTISPAMVTPLRVLNCEIPSSDIYKVESGIYHGETLDVFPKQPASLLYKIIPRGDTPLETETSKRSLALTIDFACLDEECLGVIEDQFMRDIGSSKFQQIARLLTPRLLDAFRSQWSAYDLETISLIREVEMLSYEHVQWDSVTSSLGGNFGKEVVSWLKEWHAQHPVLPLPDINTAAPNRQIIIPVDVPEIQIVHTANLSIPKPSNLTHATVGEMIPATLTIYHTRRWCPVESREPESSLEFSYELLVNPDIWLVGGRRRGNFTAKEGESRSFTVMLLPQRPGHLLLPGLEIKTFVMQVSDPEFVSAPQRKLVPCEVDYQNHAETVLVSPNLRKTTVTLDVSGGGGVGSWLVESERRVGIAG